MKKLLFLLFIALAGCHSKSTKEDAPLAVVKATDMIRNNIQVTSTGGVKVLQAFMMSQNGALLNNENKIEVGELVELRMLTSNWSDFGGKLSLGASEKITTDDNTVAVDATDVFKGQPAIPSNKTQMIRLQATVTKQDISYKYYLVQFKVWNKNAKESIEGSYKLYLK